MKIYSQHRFRDCGAPFATRLIESPLWAKNVCTMSSASRQCASCFMGLPRSLVIDTRPTTRSSVQYNGSLDYDAFSSCCGPRPHENGQLLQARVYLRALYLAGAITWASCLRSAIQRSFPHLSDATAKTHMFIFPLLLKIPPDLFSLRHINAATIPSRILKSTNNIQDAG